jgi:hypothetical protein
MGFLPQVLPRAECRRSPATPKDIASRDHRVGKKTDCVGTAVDKLAHAKGAKFIKVCGQYPKITMLNFGPPTTFRR